MKRLPAFFYQLPSGREPVREWLKTLSREDRRTIGEDVKDVEFSWPIGMPLCRSMGRGMWEVRSDLAGGRTARILFYVKGGRMVLLHGFIKKAEKTSPSDLALALRRMRDIA